MAAKAKKPAASAAEAKPDAVLASPHPLPALDYHTLADMTRDNLATVMRANAALAEGLEAISKAVLGYARTSLESASRMAAALLAAKTLEDVVQVNAEFARQSLDSLFERSARLSEMGLQVANETLAPFGAQIEAAITKLTNSVAV